MVRTLIRAAMISGLLCAVFVVGLAGCSATQSGRGGDDVAAFEPPTWPAPPLEPRIRFVKAFASERDLGREKTFGDTISTFLTGAAPPTEHLMQPMDIVVTNGGSRIYVSDFGTHQVYLFDMDAKTMKRVGGEHKEWGFPFGLAMDRQGLLYVADQEAKTISVIGQNGEVQREFSDDSLERPTDVEIDEDRGVIYVVDGSHQNSTNHYVKVFDMEGNFQRNIGLGKGFGDGNLLFPTYMTLGPEGRLYVTDTVNSRVCVFEPDGTYVRQIGARGNGFGMFDKPKGVALDSFGNVYVVDSGWSNVQIFNQEGDVLLFFGGRGAFPGLMRNPTGLTISEDDKIYVADYLNNRVDIYELINTKAEDSFLKPPDGAGAESPGTN